MASGFVCYHHHNDSSRYAVATCTKCGKNLCSECVDTFKGANGKVLCGECKQAEIATTYNMLERTKATMKKEIIGMIVGAVLGLILMAILLAATDLPAIIPVLCPFVIASLPTLINKVKGMGLGWLVSILVFIVFFFISPIVLVYRILVRIKHMKNIKAINATLAKAHSALGDYIAAAEQVTGVEELQRNQLREKLRLLEARQNDQDDSEKQMLLNKIKELEERQKKAEESMQGMQQNMNVNFEDLQTQINGMK